MDDVGVMITANSQPLRSDLKQAFDAWTGPNACAEILKAGALTILEEIDRSNTAAVGDPLSYVTLVDAAIDEVLARVRPDSSIVRTYDALPLLIDVAFNLLSENSPFRTGAYQESHRLFVDGSELAAVTEDTSNIRLPQGTKKLVFMPAVGYARLIEGGWSDQTPEGVYQVVATMLSGPFASVADISFGYHEFPGELESEPERKARPNAPRDLRQPAIIVAVR